VKRDARLIKLLIRAHQFNTTLVGSEGAPFAILAEQQGVGEDLFNAVTLDTCEVDQLRCTGAAFQASSAAIKSGSPTMLRTRLRLWNVPPSTQRPNAASASRKG
jgi:hypothetical protein